MSPGEILTEDIEQALGRYMGMSQFPTEEWPKVAALMSRIVSKAYVYAPTAWQASQNAKDLVEALGELAETVSRVMI